MVTLIYAVTEYAVLLSLLLWRCNVYVIDSNCQGTGETNPYWTSIIDYDCFK